MNNKYNFSSKFRLANIFSLLVFTASIVDATWYIFLTFIVTSDIVLRFLKNKSIIIHRVIGILFIIISAILLIDIMK